MIKTKEMEEYAKYCDENGLYHPDFEDAHNMPKEQMDLAMKAFRSYVKECAKLITPEMLERPSFLDPQYKEKMAALKKSKEK